MTEDIIYLDYNATTPLLPEVVDAMLPFLRDHFGNPSSSHALGRAAREAVGMVERRSAWLGRACGGRRRIRAAMAARVEREDIEIGRERRQQLQVGAGRGAAAMAPQQHRPAMPAAAQAITRARRRSVSRPPRARGTWPVQVS